MSAPDSSDIQRSFKGILLDLDNTLYEYEPCHTFALTKCYELFNTTVHPLEFREFMEVYVRARALVKKNNAGTSGSRSRYLYFQHMIENSIQGSAVTHALALGNLYRQSFLEHMRIKPWVRAFIDESRAAGMPIAVVTNQESSFQYEKLVRLGLDQAIDYIVTSEEAGVEKPNTKIFMLALAKMGLSAEEVVMIGDDSTEDGAGAANANIKFILCG